MPYLIDGNNFIGHASQYSLKDPKSKYQLASKLFIFQRMKRTRVFLVFDGTPDSNFTDIKPQENKFIIKYPPPDQNADWVIKKIIEKQTDLRRFFVVSSDHEIRRFAKAKGATSLSCKEFNRELIAMLKKNKKARETEKKVSSLSPLEVNHWLKIFKRKKD